jgi:hypothetical protein
VDHFFQKIKIALILFLWVAVLISSAEAVKGDQRSTELIKTATHKNKISAILIF